MAKVHGQHEGRLQRLQETASWLGATPLDHIGQPILVGPSVDEVEMDKVFFTIDAIRQSVKDGVAVRCTEMHKPNVDMIKQTLSPEELTQVRFDYDEMAGGQAF